MDYNNVMKLTKYDDFGIIGKYAKSCRDFDISPRFDGNSEVIGLLKGVVGVSFDRWITLAVIPSKLL